MRCIAALLWFSSILKEHPRYCFQRILESKLSEAKSKKDTLKARAASAKTSKEVNEMLSSVGTSSAYAAFERMEEKVMTLEAESEAIAELPGVSGATGDDLDRKFAMLEGDDVDSELVRAASVELQCMWLCLPVGVDGTRGSSLVRGTFRRVR
jgi:hypothetical protein